MKKKWLGVLLSGVLAVTMVLPVCAEETKEEELVINIETGDELIELEEALPEEVNYEIDNVEGYKEATPIVEGQTYEVSKDAPNEAWYKFETSAEARVYDFMLATRDSYSYIYIYDQDVAQIKQGFAYDNVKFTCNIKLESNKTYYIKTVKTNRTTYNLLFNSSSDVEDTREKAMPISLNKQYSDNMVERDVDVYKFVTKKAKYHFKLVSMDSKPNFYVYLKTPDGATVKMFYVTNLTEFDIDLLEGQTYYLEVKYHVGAAGEYNFTITGPEYVNPAFPFVDVDAGKWYYNAVKYVYDNQIMSGTSATTFAPNAYTTREMMVTIVYNAAGKPATNYNGKFADVPNGKWFSTAVSWAVNNGITSGKSDNMFGVGENVTREQVAVFLYNFAKNQGKDVSAQADLSKYGDAASVSSWAKTAMSWANAKGVINGSNGKLNPKGNATRAEIAQMIMSYKQKV